VARRNLTDAEKERAERLAAALRRMKAEENASVSELAQRAGVGYETVRALLAAKSAGPSFFLVADLARALNAGLDELADETR
jgi:transcriptional regulator with XRE-family HTH domain